MFEYYKKIFSGKKSKSFIHINKLSNFQGIPDNLILDTDLNILRLQPTLKLIKKSENFWKQHNYKNKKFYNTASKYQKNRNRIIIDKINKIVKIKKLNNILDYGCGDLLFLKMMMKSVKLKTLYGYDINVQKSYYKKIKGVELKIYDKKDVNKKRDYDLISLNWVVTNTFNPWKIINNCKNLLKDDSYLIIVDSNVIINKNLIKKVDTYLKVEDLKINQCCRPFHFTTLDLKNILILNGFHVIETLHNNKLNFKILIAKKKLNTVKHNNYKLKINNKKIYMQFLRNFLTYKKS